MSLLSRLTVLNTLIRHETLTVDDLARTENIGFVPNEEHLGFLLGELHESGHILMLHGVTPSTYTITTKGIEEGARLNEEAPNN